MGGRYYITGVQIGMIMAFAELGETDEILELLDKIEEEQFTGATLNKIH